MREGWPRKRGAVEVLELVETGDCVLAHLAGNVASRPEREWFAVAYVRDGQVAAMREYVRRGQAEKALGRGSV